MLSICISEGIYLYKPYEKGGRLCDVAGASNPSYCRFKLTLQQNRRSKGRRGGVVRENVPFLFEKFFYMRDERYIFEDKNLA